MAVGEFPLPKSDMSGMSGIPCNARPKNGRGGKKHPRAYRGKKKEKKFVIWKKKFWRLEKQNVGWKKNLLVEKKMLVGEFPLPKAEMSGHSLECKTQKRHRRGKTP